MRKAYLVCLFFLFGFIAAAQTATENGERLAHKIANRMKDSLDLTPQQRNAIFQINRDIHSEKQAAMQQYGSSAETGRALQRIENKRDSLYRTVLTEEKYLLYSSKKTNLVKAN